jgi:hypothetical protein
MMESVGMMTFPRYGKSSKKMFEITNQCCISQKPMAYFKTKKCMIHKMAPCWFFLQPLILVWWRLAEMSKRTCM